MDLQKAKIKSQNYRWSINHPRFGFYYQTLEKTPKMAQIIILILIDDAMLCYVVIVSLRNTI